LVVVPLILKERNCLRRQAFTKCMFQW
jgi:hypothetical protein